MNIHAHSGEARAAFDAGAERWIVVVYERTEKMYR
jgi:hypothetical protein